MREKDRTIIQDASSYFEDQSSLKWTVFGQSGRFIAEKELKVDAYQKAEGLESKNWGLV